MVLNRKQHVLPAILVFSLWLSGGLAQHSQQTEFSFIVAGDMRQYAGPKYQSPQYFMGACEAINRIGKGVFMVSPGDIDPPWHVRSTLDKVLGSDYIWFPVIGNHEAETVEDMKWLRNWGKDIPFLDRRGPQNSEETTFSFDYGDAHFAVINQYYDGRSDAATDGDITDALFDWLRTDLEANDKLLTFVFGHEPIVVVPDMDNGRVRHLGDALDAHPENNHRFLKLLRDHGVTAYFCGHTHNASYTNINGVWQIDTGHSRGLGDKGAPSTFVKIRVRGNDCLVEFYRDDARGGEYRLTESIILK